MYLDISQILLEHPDSERPWSQRAKRGQAAELAPTVG